MDIVIYTNPEILLHKRTENLYCYWTMKRPPKNFKEGDKIYFAVKGEVKGYFICNFFDPENDEETVEWDSNSWCSIDGVYWWQFCKPFRGFRYRWWNDKPDKGGER